MDDKEWIIVCQHVENFESYQNLVTKYLPDRCVRLYFIFQLPTKFIYNRTPRFLESFSSDGSDLRRLLFYSSFPRDVTLETDDK